MKDIIVLDGSPRKNGLTRKLFQALNFPEESYDYIHVKNLNIKHCIACDYCKSNYGKCSLSDDMTKVYNQLINAKGIIVLTPVYFNSVTSILKQLIDRTQVFFYAKYHHGKMISANSPWIITLSTGGARAYDHQFLGVELALEHFYKNLGGKEVFKYYLPNTDRIDVEDFQEDIQSKFQSVRTLIL